MLIWGGALVSTSKTADSVTTYLKHIFDLPKNDLGAICYRGESDGSCETTPSIMRGVRANAENRIFSELMAEAPTEFSNDKSMFDKLVRAQHYGLPTRLLDVSLNPLVALYFACNDKDHHEESGVVQIFSFKEDRVKFSDNDTVSLICNLARLSDDDRQHIIDIHDKYKSKSLAEKRTFKEDAVINRLVQFVRVEKPYFTNDIEPVDLFKYYFVYLFEKQSTCDRTVWRLYCRWLVALYGRKKI